MKIIYTRPTDGGVTVIHGVPKEQLERSLRHWFLYLLWPLTLTEEKYKEIVWERSVPSDAINPMEIQNDKIPSSREFRDAWKQDGNNITHDLEKVKAMQIERTESAIKPIMQALNAELVEAIVSGNNGAQASIMAKKDRLKNGVNALKELVPQSIEQIKAATPILEI